LKKNTESVGEPIHGCLHACLMYVFIYMIALTVLDNTVGLQPCHPVAQDWLPTEAKQG